MRTRVLVINPGSTSTKIAVYDEKSIVFTHFFSHDFKCIEKYQEFANSLELCRHAILEKLQEENILPSSIRMIVLGGDFLPLELDSYEMEEETKYLSHIGARVAYQFANEWNSKAYVYDPVSAELTSLTRRTGIKEMQPNGNHQLNMKASVIKFAEKWGIPFQSINVITAHIGDGMTISLFHNGKMIEAISDIEGTFSQERAGRRSVYQVIDRMDEKKRSNTELTRMVQREEELRTLIRTTDIHDIEDMIQSGNEEVELFLQAMALNIAKNIANLTVVVSGQLEAIILTGEQAKSKMLTDWVKDYVRYIAPVEIFPGDLEMEALANMAVRMLKEEAYSIVTPELVGV